MILSNKAVGSSQPFGPDCIDLAQPRLGARVLSASDEFFAAKERMLDPAEPVFIADKFDRHGKWMDGWETRCRAPGHDHGINRLGLYGVIRGVNFSTRYFSGNYPSSARMTSCGESRTLH